MSIEYFWDVHFTSIAIECWVVDLDMDGLPSFPHNWFAVLVYHSEIVYVSLSTKSQQTEFLYMFIKM